MRLISTKQYQYFVRYFYYCPASEGHPPSQMLSLRIWQYIKAQQRSHIYADFA